MNEFDIIIRPHITEKSTDAAANGKYTFVVDLNATKIDIKKAIVTIDTDPKQVEYTVNGEKKTKKYKNAIEDFGFVQ